MENEKSANSEKKNDTGQKTVIKRRTLLKALIGLPILGVFAFELFKKWTYDQEKKNRIIQELGLGNIPEPVIIKSSSGSKPVCCSSIRTFTLTMYD